MKPKPNLGMADNMTNRQLTKKRAEKIRKDPMSKNGHGEHIYSMPVKEAIRPILYLMLKSIRQVYI